MGSRVGLARVGVQGWVGCWPVQGTETAREEWEQVHTCTLEPCSPPWVGVKVLVLHGRTAEAQVSQ